MDGRSAAFPSRLYDAYIFDLDGTIYLGDELLPGARRLINELRARGQAVRFVSNNPTKDPVMYAEKLAQLGLPTPVEEIVNTVVTMTRWLLTNHPDAVVFPIGEAPLIRALGNAGIRMSSNPAEMDIVIASYDRGFTYEKLQIAFNAIWFYKRARLVATNPDRYCPMAGYEHAISHMLDMSAEHYGRAIASHGCQCGISTIACAIAWRKWLSDFQPEKVDVDACFPSVEEMERCVRATFDEIDPSGAMAAECWNTYSKKLEGWHQARPRFEAFLRDWPRQRNRLAELVHPPAAVVAGLTRAQHPLRYEDFGIPEQQARWAFKNGHMMRQRFSFADLLNYLGWLDDAFVDDVFTQMGTLAPRGSHSDGS